MIISDKNQVFIENYRPEAYSPKMAQRKKRESFNEKAEKF